MGASSAKILSSCPTSALNSNLPRSLPLMIVVESEPFLVQDPESSRREAPGPRMFHAAPPAPLASQSPIGSPSGHGLLASLLYSTKMN